MFASKFFLMVEILLLSLNPSLRASSIILTPTKRPIALALTEFFSDSKNAPSNCSPKLIMQNYYYLIKFS